MDQELKPNKQKISSLHEVEIQEFGAVISKDGDREVTRRKVGDINHGISVNSPQEVEVVFRNLESKLGNLILEAEVIFGCVAWLTNESILKALAQKKVHIAIQKEDFLRPDTDSSVEKLHKLYSNLKPYFYKKVKSIDHWGWDDLTDYQDLFEGLQVELKYLHRIENQGDNFNAYLQPIRCVGGYNRQKKKAFPRMHNKFFVFFDESLTPFAVWTGSFNPTYNGSNSLENAVIIRNEDIARAYFQEFELIWVMSEELNWSSDWCEPDYMIGNGVDKDQFIEMYIGSGPGIPITYHEADNWKDCEE